MKKILILLILILTLTGCSETITLDNVEQFENEYNYSNVFMGKFRKCEDNGIITDAKEFTDKFLTIVFNRSYKSKRTIEQETIMFDESFLEKNKEELEKSIISTNRFYEEYELETELAGVNYKKVIDVNGDAYVNCVAKVRIISCNDWQIAKIMGFDGVNSNVSSMYNIKLKYVDRGYMVYDYEVVEKEGYLLPFEQYEDIIYNTLSEEDKLRRLAFLVSKAQNDRIYYEFFGDEDYKYLSKSCIEEINKDRDNAQYTKDLYIKYKLSTKLEKCDVLEIIKTENGYTLKVNLTVKILECISKDTAIALGFENGVGSTKQMDYEYYIVYEDGEYKLNGSKLMN